jgi:hypothetical protein
LAGVLASRKAKLRTALVVVGAVVIVFVIIPRIFHALHTVSTDDAYVNSYVTFVALSAGRRVCRASIRGASGILRRSVRRNAVTAQREHE